ncbi:MAG: hypothetical protein P4L83_24040 [Nevskia sp.]|nr:hypothetical protein [Nevskia sp.]
MTIESIRVALAPWYLQIKFVHLLAVMVWIWSTSVAYMSYLVPVFKAWRRNPGDRGLIAMRDWVMDRFDEGVIYEHVAFPVILVTGPLLYIAGGWSTGAAWLMLKLLVVAGVMVPMELCDYYLSHFGGNKRRIRGSDRPQRHEAMVHAHWWFLLVTTPAVAVFSLLIVFLAVTKPI